MLEMMWDESCLLRSEVNQCFAPSVIYSNKAPGGVTSVAVRHKHESQASACLLQSLNHVIRHEKEAMKRDEEHNSGKPSDHMRWITFPETWQEPFWSLEQRKKSALKDSVNRHKYLQPQSEHSRWHWPRESLALQSSFIYEFVLNRHLPLWVLV